MAIDINVPSQVKTFANLAAFPATGVVKTIFIAEDTNKTYRWTGSVYVEVSAAGASGITIGTTAITSGTVGRVLFEGTGNVVQESANLFWDNTNGRLGIGTSSPAFRLEVQGGDVRFANALTIGTVGSTGWQFSSNTLKIIQNGLITLDTANNRELSITNQSFTTTFLNIKPTGNVLIGTTTDAGFKLDVNGTARISGTTLTLSANNPQIVWSTGAFALYNSTTRLLRVDYLGNYQFQQSIIVAASSGTAINASAILEANSTTQGFLPPRMTTTQRNAIASPAAGLVVYDNTDNKHYGYNGTTWNAFY